MNPAVGALARAGLIGAVSGLRSQWGIAAVSLSARPGETPSAAQRLLSRPWVRGAVLAAAAGEFVADKAPGTSSRLAPAGLVPRLVLGALSGMALAERRRPAVPPIAAAVAGAAAAGASAVAGVRWRRTAGARTDAVAAAAEDVLAAALAWAACTDAGRPTQGGGRPRGDSELIGAGAAGVDDAPDGGETSRTQAYPDRPGD
ncbi:DUF4126 family protein [Streptomyces salyersiae]|uniref:DUF4126 family protein n=1 Tax=Streptomyces salyersiae TaxID=3075530 RepID=A0ABU2RMX3_9ACTN|nr:DUF4126 family protein [Streptomyces sp. DSM 41770]MDT0429633.1 DUF4126 family protein [Streptomyces sp. DSM 41770]